MAAWYGAWQKGQNPNSAHPLLLNLATHQSRAAATGGKESSDVSLVSLATPNTPTMLAPRMVQNSVVMSVLSNSVEEFRLVAGEQFVPRHDDIAIAGLSLDHPGRHVVVQRRRHQSPRACERINNHGIPGPIVG